MVNSNVYTDQGQRDKLVALKRKAGSWLQLGKVLGFNPGLLWSVAAGKRPAPKPLVARLRSRDPILLHQVRSVAVPFLKRRD